MKSQSSLTEYIKGVQTITHKVLQGDVFACLDSLEDDSISCAVTSPPYWSQRDYGFDHQIGNEPTLEEYIARLVKIFEKLKQKLQPPGIFFLNMGDKYVNKYGNTPLGMIPYKLAYWMTKYGWKLEDIIIWYKPNHMPSSVQNRFTNTYEPVFVFSKSEDNYYSKFKSSPNYSNILKITLQQLPYKHMASFPEKLVEKLISCLNLTDKSIILDPFAGSGTTTKAIKNLNLQNKKKYNSILIEAFGDYVKIILDRCKLSRKVVEKIEYIEYDFKDIKLDYKPREVKATKKKVHFDLKTDQLIIKLIENEEEYEHIINSLINQKILDNIIDDDGILFFGLPDHNINKIFEFSQIPNVIIRNMIVVSPPNTKDWFPLFFLVKDIKSIRYKFDIDSIRVSHSYEQDENWNDVNFVGYKVIRGESFFKTPKEGLIVKVLEKREDGLPKWSIIKWADSTYTIEETINYPLKERKTEFYCPNCSNQLKRYHHIQKPITCSNCDFVLWKTLDSIPLIKLNKRHSPNIDIDKIDLDVNEKNTKRNYEGKFKDAKRINMGQSPGARASVSEIYFTLQRYYTVKQGLMCDYLNLHRKKKKLSKKALTEKFPSSYFHTVGHWLRKDMGGSLPKVEDMNELNRILELDEEYVNYNNRMGLKLQSVSANAKGKNPGDFLEKSKEVLLEMLKKLEDK
ncbi:MAG: DNA methyltransferase [Candidatus Hodarchaeota archaeon]